MRKFLVPVSLMVFSLSIAACQSGGGAASTATSAADKEAAASVNGTKITMAEVNRVVAQQLRGQEGQLSQIELAAARSQALDSLITQEVLFQRAQKDTIKVEDQEITTFIQNTKQESGMTEEAFQKQLKENNQTEPQLREDIRKQLAIRKLTEKLVSQLKVQDVEVENYFSQNPKQFVAQPGVSLSDIIVDPADNGAKNDVKGELPAQQKISEIYNRLRSGSDFATIARAESEHESFARSGDLGFIPQEQFGALSQQGLPAQLAAQLMSMKEGDITSPIRDQRGVWHIFKVTGKRTEKRDLTLSDPEVRKQISDGILEQRRQLVNSALLTRARDEAKIENYLAQRMLENPNTFGVLRPAGSAPAASPASSPAVSASPAASASPAKAATSPAATATPAEKK